MPFPQPMSRTFTLPKVFMISFVGKDNQYKSANFLEGEKVLSIFFKFADISGVFWYNNFRLKSLFKASY